MPTSPTNWGAGGGGAADASPFDDVLLLPPNLNIAASGGFVALTANTCVGNRIIVPRSGTLRDISVYINVSSGNIVAGILDTTATTRNRLYHTGSIPSPGTGWRTLGDPQLAVTKGDHLDVYVGANNSVVAMPVCLALNASQIAQLPAGFFVSPLGGTPLLMWSTASFPIGTTIAEASLASSNAAFLTAMRIV